MGNPQARHRRQLIGSARRGRPNRKATQQMSELLVVIGVGGMGEAIARRSGSGRRIVLADYDRSLLDRVESGMRDDGYDIVAHLVDVSSHESVTELAQACAELGDVRYVAHTAGISGATGSLEAIVRVDLAGVAFSLDEFGKVIAPGGAAVYIASMAGTITAPYITHEVEEKLISTASDELVSLPFVRSAMVTAPMSVYGIAKRGNQLRVHAASHVWGRRGARVNTISPGIIATPQGRQELAGGAGGVMRTMIDKSGLRRLGTPGDIAAAAAFLLSPDSSFITGSDLLVDGGTVAAIRAGILAV
jgi:NAD(P)-dependent dehydrogenase (short-subunit alcohol dehydrogenase family)